jgi:hypothetical protein
MAYRQKDKLLMFDKEHAKRTHVHDAQADYYETGRYVYICIYLYLYIYVHVYMHIYTCT